MHFEYHGHSKTRRGIHFMFELYYTKMRVLGAGRILKIKNEMDATQSFGVSMISVVPSNPQLTLAHVLVFTYVRSKKLSHLAKIL